MPKPQKKATDAEMKTLTHAGYFTEVKEQERQGQPVGIVAGYIATWDLDRGLDRFVKGAFADSLGELRAEKRQIRLKDHHGRTVGGFPIENVREDDIGLFGIGEINLNVQQGRDAYNLAKQGVLTDFSIGYSVQESEFENETRVIMKALVWEGSIVDEPMNPKANIVEVKDNKTVIPFLDLPVAGKDLAWDPEKAVANLKEFTGSEDSPSADYKNGFLWFDKDNKDAFESYRLPIADIVKGKMVAVPRAVIAAASVLMEDAGSIDIKEADRAGVIKNVEKYYAKIGIDSPFDEEEKSFFMLDDVKQMDVRAVEDMLKKADCMSNQAVKYLVGCLDLEQKADDTQGTEDENEEVLEEIKAFTESLKNKKPV